MRKESDENSSSPQENEDFTSEEDEEVFIPYENRSEWIDVEPIFETYEDRMVVRIDYSEKFRNVFSYFKAILKREEKSERAFNLTTECIALNPANYTVWYFRRKILKHLEKDLKQELSFVDSVIINNSKNYQVWQHRKWLIENLNDFSGEKNFLEILHCEDDKNYHVWQYRQWLIKYFSLWFGEIQMTTKMLEEDVRNNSAWNHRYYVLLETGKMKEDDFLEKEVDFCLSKIKLAPNNESAWNYLRGILREFGITKNKNVNDYCEEMLKNNTANCHLMNFVIDCLEQTLRESETLDQNLVKKAVDLTIKLETEVDTLRKNYWCFVRKSFIEEFGEQ